MIGWLNFQLMLIRKIEEKDTKTTACSCEEVKKGKVDMANSKLYIKSLQKWKGATAAIKWLKNNYEKH